MKNFNGDFWWNEKNPAFRESRKKQATKELIELKGKYDYFMLQKQIKN